MKIPNMCLVLKLDNGKVVLMANEQNHRAIQYTVLVYRLAKHPPWAGFSLPSGGGKGNNNVADGSSVPRGGGGNTTFFLVA